MSPSLNAETSPTSAKIDATTLESLSWYALRVRSRHEKKVAVLLQGKGIEISLPLKQITRLWSDRQKLIWEPLFQGYVFTRIPFQARRFEVLQTTGAVAFCGIGGKIKAVPDEQMYWLEKLLSADEDIRLEREFPAGTRVRVTRGPWLGIEGIVQQARENARLVIWLDGLQQGVSVNMNASLLQSLNREHQIK
jgi:transcription antitermination factor NusG